MLRNDPSHCSTCGRTDDLCICNPLQEGAFFASYEEKAEYYRTHPDKKGRVRSTAIPVKLEEGLLAILKAFMPQKSEEELRQLLQTVADKENS